MNTDNNWQGPLPAKPMTIRAALNREGARLRSRGFSKHSKLGLARRIARRKQRRWMLNRTFSRTIETQLRTVQ